MSLERRHRAPTSVFPKMTCIDKSIGRYKRTQRALSAQHLRIPGEVNNNSDDVNNGSWRM
jgi:hypothetical protein